MRVLMLERPHSAATFGGEQVHLHRLAQEVTALGVPVDVSTDVERARSGDYDIVHLFNIQQPLEAAAFVEQLEGSGLPLVLTPIHADLRRGVFARRVQKHLAQFAGDPHVLDQRLAQLRQRQLTVQGVSRFEQLPRDEQLEAARRRVLGSVDAVFPLTSTEAEALAQDVGTLPEVVRVAPVAADRCGTDPNLFRRHLGLREPFVLLPAASIEPNKNQWLTLYALRFLALPVVVTGTCTEPDYQQLCQDAAPKDTRFVGLLEPTLLMSAMAAADAVVHTSVVECSSLSAIEGAAANGNLIVGDTGSEHETFQELARIVDPLDVRAIEREVQKALCGGPLAAERCQALRDRARSFSWAASAETVATGYEEVLRRRRPRSQKPSVAVHFRGVVLGPSGFACEGREWLAALEAADLCPSLWGALLGDHDVELPPNEQEIIDTCANRAPATPRITFHHSLIPHFEPDTDAQVNVLHTVFEVEGLPPGWAAAVNHADRVLVMTEWNRKVFERSGVEAHKLCVLPPPVDARAYEPGPRRDKASPFRWLTVMDWQLRKGHDVLLEAFGRAFRQGEAELWIKVMPHPGLSRDQIQAHCEAALRQHGSSPPTVRVIGDVLPTGALHDLYREADGFVLASRGEGWGRPVHEAMLMELPVVVSHGSALSTLVPDESVGYPVRCSLVPVSEEAAREVPAFRGQLWHEPEVDHLMVRLREVTWNRDEAQVRAVEGRKHIARLTDPVEVGRRLRQLLGQLQHGGVVNGS